MAIGAEKTKAILFREWAFKWDVVQEILAPVGVNFPQEVVNIVGELCLKFRSRETKLLVCEAVGVECRGGGGLRPVVIKRRAPRWVGEHEGHPVQCDLVGYWKRQVCRLGAVCLGRFDVNLID